MFDWRAILSGNTFPASSTVTVLSNFSNQLKTTTNLPLISNVSYSLQSGLYIDTGGSLTIASGNTITGSGLYVGYNGNGGSLSASNVNFQNSRVELDQGRAVSLSMTSSWATTCTSMFGLGDFAERQHLPGQLDCGRVVWDQLKTSATLPHIANVTAYSLQSGLYVDSGGTLTIAHPNTVTGSGLYVDYNGSGGRCRPVT